MDLHNIEKKMTMKVLVVDDSRFVRERLKEMLSEVIGVEAISQAKDTPEAIEMLGTLSPDLMILDIEMPGRSGIDLLREIEKRKKPPLAIVLTNHSSPQYRRACIDAGADFFFDKSSEFDKVAQVLKQLSNKGVAERKDYEESNKKAILSKTVSKN
jgi:Response regulator containing a CheY-like receiver domain and an HTH DNA-binding domain